MVDQVPVLLWKEIEIDNYDREEIQLHVCSIQSHQE